MDFIKYPGFQFPKERFNNIDWARFGIPKIGWSKMPKLRIGDAVASLPIVQGGMGVGISL